MAEAAVISVIVPVYNAAAHLPRTLAALRAQTYPHLEVLLVDDGSTDESPALCDAAALQDPRFRVLHQPNGGPAAARNAALDGAHGAWLAFVDADDVVTPGYLQALLDVAEVQGAQLVVSDCVICTPAAQGGENVTAQLPAPVRELVPHGWRARRFGMVEANRLYATRAQLWDAFMASRLPWSLWGKLYARELWEGVRFDAADYIAEDLDANARIFSRTDVRVATTAECGYLYLEHEGSVDHSFTRRHLRQFQVFERVAALPGQLGLEPTTSVAVWYQERMLNCLKKAHRARAMQGPVGAEVKRALAAHRAEALAHASCDRGLRLRIRLSQLGPLGWWLLERV